MIQPFKTLIKAILILIIFPTLSNAQIKPIDSQKKIILRTIDSIFNKTLRQELLKDSIALYAINFTVDIKRTGTKTEVSEIKANDKLAFNLFPSFKRLYSINYNALLGSRKNVLLVIPVLIARSSTEQKDDASNSSIDFNAALNAAYSLTSAIPYSNESESKTALDHRIYKFEKSKTIDRFNMNKIFLAPYVIKVLNIK